MEELTMEEGGARGAEEETEPETNYALPYWTFVDELLTSFIKTFLEQPMVALSKMIEGEDGELVMCACCCIWVPLLTAYTLAMVLVFCLLATGLAFLGAAQSIIFLAIGIWPGFVIALRIAFLTIIQLPRNLYFHLKITWMNIARGLYIKAVCVILLLPAQLLLPPLLSVLAASTVLACAIIAFLGCPLAPWHKMNSSYNTFYNNYVTVVAEKVEKYNPEDYTDYGSHYWQLAQEILTAVPEFAVVPLNTIKDKKELPTLPIAATVIVVFFIFWVPLLVLYGLYLGIVYFAIAVALFCVGMVQSLIHLSFGVLPGLLIGLVVGVISVIRLPFNLYYHCVIVIKTIRKGLYIKAFNLFLMLPFQLCVPALLVPISLSVSTLTCTMIAMLGRPQVPWHMLRSVPRRIWVTLATEASTKFDEYSSAACGEKSNYLKPYWKAVGDLVMNLNKVAVEWPAGHLKGVREGRVRAAGGDRRGSATSKDAVEVLVRTWFSLPLWLPIGLIHLLTVALCFLCTSITLAIIGLLQSTIYLALGIWPSLFIASGFTLISLVRLPWNIYYHCLITYRTVMLRKNLKVVSFILVPPTHFVVPVVIAVLSFGAAIPVCAAASFVGYPQIPWQKLLQNTNQPNPAQPDQPNPTNLILKFWKRYVTDVKAHVNNYGHESGIPANWDGKMYGLPLDPMTIVMSILFYVYAAPPITIGVIVIVFIKVIPFMLRAVVEYWNIMNYCKQVGLHLDQIEALARWDACGQYSTILKEYFNLVNKFKPSILMEAVDEYKKEFNIRECVPKRNEEVCILFCCLCTVVIFWAFGIIVVLAFTVFAFLFCFLAWIVGWPLTIIIPPVLYLLSWFCLLVLYPIGYTFAWILGFVVTLIAPWPVIALVMFTGPFLALRVPFIVFRHNLLNPAEMDLSFKMGIRMPRDIIKKVDKETGKFSFRNWTIWRHEEEPGATVLFADFDYWDLFYDRSKKEVLQVINKNWLTAEDIGDQSATAMVAIPGFTMLAILVESVKKEKTDRSLLYWGPGKQCTHSRRNRRDNIANHFFPQLVRLKDGLRGLQDLDRSATYIAASLCDGSDARTQELQAVLGQRGDEGERKKCLKVRSDVENVVHSLLRVKRMQAELMKVCNHKFRPRNRDSGLVLDMAVENDTS